MFEDAGLEIVGRKCVQDDVAFGARRVLTGTGARISFEAEHVAGAANIAQLRAAVRFVPERDGALLDDEDLRAMGFALPEEVFVPLEKAYAAVGSHRQQVAQLGDLERRVLFQKVGDAVADFRSVHGRRRVGGLEIVLQRREPFSWV